MKLSINLIFGVALISLVGCSKTNHSSETDHQAPKWLSKCPDFSVTGKSPVAGNAECGSFEVLENPNGIAGNKINVNVLRVPSINPTPQADPLFIIAGGPGQSAVDLAGPIAPLFSEVRKNRDLIFVDQRGTGHSSPLECPELDTDAQENAHANEDQYIEHAAKLCVEQYGARLSYYATPFAAQDLNEVRKQLGYKKINLWSASYGTRVALEFMREFPEQTRAAILDGVAPYDIALPSNMDEDAMSALTAIDTQCAEDMTCKIHFTDLVIKAKQIAQNLQQAPLHIELRHPRTQKKEMTKIDGDDFSGLIRHMLYDRDMSSLIPQIINDTAQGDYQLLGSLLFLAKAKTDLKGINQTMHYAVVCSEDFPQYQNQLTSDNQLTSNSQLTGKTPFLNSRSVQQYAKICAQFPKAQIPQNLFESKTNLTPTLILSGAQDPATPPRWADKVKAHLPNAVSVVAPGGHHGISMQGCGSQLISLFIERGTAQGLETKCIQAIKPLAIHLPPQAVSSSSAQSTSNKSSSNSSLSNSSTSNNSSASNDSSASKNSASGKEQGNQK